MTEPMPTPEQITLLEDIATGAWNMLQTVIAQRNPTGKFQIKTPHAIEDRVMAELQAAGWIERRGGRLGLTGSGSKVWKAELLRRRRAPQEDT